MRELERDQAQIIAPEALPPITLVGRGRVGGSLARSAARHGLEASLSGRREHPDAVSEAELILLCVPDGAIAEAARAAREAAPRLRMIGHTSGAAGLEPLGAADPGVGRFSIHPLQTVPDPASDLEGVAAAVAGDREPAAEIAWRLARELGLRPFELGDDQRAAYHAAASIASNLLVALEESAAALLERAGIEDGRTLLGPLVETTARNWTERGPAALTGPIARGDGETVDRHREAIGALFPELLDTYEALAGRARSLATDEALVEPLAKPTESVGAAPGDRVGGAA